MDLEGEECLHIINQYRKQNEHLTFLYTTGIITLNEYHEERFDLVNVTRKRLGLVIIPKEDEGRYCVGVDYATDNSENVVTVLEKVKDGFVVRVVASFPTLTGMKQVLMAITKSLEDSFG